MEAAATPKRELSGEKAQRIVDAMRATVGERGATGATFDVVAREAGVSRGLLHYYFGSKEKLLAEVARRECDLRMERLSAGTAGAAGAGELLASMAQALRDMLDEAPEFLVILLELHTLGRQNADIGAELSELHRRVRGHLGGILAQARDAGVIGLAAEPEVVAEVLFSLADGLGMRMLAEPGRDFEPTLVAALAAASALVRPPGAG